MNKKLLAVSLLSALFLTQPALAQEEEEEEEEGWWIGGSLSGTSDYIFRGVSQTDEQPAVQGSFDFGHSSGFYAGVWASNVDFDVPEDGIDVEIDYYLGWVFPLPHDLELDVQAVRYTYPGSNRGFGIDYNEYIFALSFLEYFTATFGFANDYLNTGENQFYYQLSADYPIGETGFGLSGSAAYSDIDEAAGDSYADFKLGVNYSTDNVTLDVSYFDTASYSDTLAEFLGPKTWADARVVFTVTVEW